MALATLGNLLRYLRTACEARPGRDLSDGELLERFAAHRDEAAFALLVQRHGPMVQAVCRRVLHDAHGAEDCFQATFLVLVRRAASIREKGCVASWLYAVALHVASRARAQAAARRQRERRAANMPRAEVLDELTWRELCSVLDEEVGRLPEKYRAPLVLCYFEGKSYEQAARELGWPKSSLAQRLTRGRKLLHGALVRRGVALSAGALVVTLGERTAGAPVSARLTLNTVQAAAGVLAGKAAPAACVSREALALAEQALKAVPAAHSGLGVLVLAACLTLAGGLTALAALPAKSVQATGQKPRAAAAEGAVPGPGNKEAVAPVDGFGDALPAGALARLGTVRFRHGFYISGLAFAPGGKTLASAGYGNAGVCVWDVSTGRALWRLPVPAQANSVSYSPDGKWLIVCGAAVWLLDAATGREVHRLGAGRFLSLDVTALSPDGRTVAAGETRRPGVVVLKGRAVILWDAPTGKVLRRLEGHGDVTALAFAKDGKTLASACSEKKIRLWDVASGKPLCVLQGHDHTISSLAFAPGGNVLASAGRDRVIRLWDVPSGRRLRELKGHEEDIGDVAFAPDGAVLASRGLDGGTRLWDPRTGRELRRWDSGFGYGTGLAYSADGKVLATGGGSGIRLWDPATGEEIRPATGHTGPLRLLRFAPGGAALVSCAADQKVLAWDLKTRRERVLGARNVTYAADLSPDGRVLAQAVYGDPCIHLCDAATGKELRALKTDTNRWRELRISPDGKLLGCSSQDRVRVWDLATGKLLNDIKEKQFGPSVVAFSPDGKLLAFGPDDHTIRLWDVAAGKEVRRWDRSENSLRILAFSPDGRSLVSYGSVGGNPLSLWDAASGRQRAQFKQFHRITALAFSPSGRTLAVIDLVRDVHPGPDDSQACTLHLLEAFSGQEIRKLAMPQGSVWAVAFAQDGRTLATGGGDSTILLWDVTPGAGDGKRKAAALAPADLGRLWSELAGEATAADRALGALVGAPKQSVLFLRERLRPAAILAEHVKLVADLDSKEFTVRDKAFRTLEGLGEAAEGVLCKALEGKPSLEMRRRLEKLLAKPDTFTFRPLRAIEALEFIGTAEARDVLTVLAERAYNPRVAQAAAAALRRLRK